jgi:ABC-2 type transport system permease protein
VAKYLRIASHLLRASIQAQAQYRVDFLIQMVLAIFWVGWNVAPLVLIFQIRPTVGDWSLEQAMLVMSAFLILRALLDGIISPNLVALVDHIRKGTFDFILLKPVDSQLMVSTAKVAPAKLVDLSCGIAIAAWSIARLDPSPGPFEILAGAAMLASGALGIYALWMLIVCSAFWFVKIDNLTFLFSSIFDAARWPISVFRGWIRLVLTFVLPVAVMTSFPAMAVMQKLELKSAAVSWGMTLALLVISRAVWRWSLRHYSSASS